MTSTSDWKTARIDGGGHATKVRNASTMGSQFDSNGTAGQAEMRRCSEHVPIVSPDFGEPRIRGSHQMERVESAQITRWRQGTSHRLDPAQEPLGHRYCRDHPIAQIVKEQIPPYHGVSRSGWSLANLAMCQTSHLGNAYRGRRKAVRTPRQCPDRPSIGLVPVALAKVGGVEIQPQVRSCSRISPLSSVSGPLMIRASRSGMRGAGRCEKGRISATGMPRFSIMKDSPSATWRTISLVFRWRSRTVEVFM